MQRKIDINAGSLPEYISLIPDKFWEKISRSIVSGWAVYDGDPKNDHLIGIILYQERYHWRSVEWLWLSTAYDIADYAADLIWDLEEDARRGDDLFGTYGLIFPGEDRLLHYYQMAQFNIETEKSNVYSFYLEQVRSDLLGKIKQNDHIIRFFAAPRSYVQSISKTLFNNSVPFPVEADIHEDDYEGDLSLLYVENDEPKGIILVSLRKDTLSVDFLYGRDQKITAMLLAASLNCAMQEYGDDTPVYAPVLSEKSAQLVEQLVPDAQRHEIKKATRAYELRKTLPGMRSAK